MGWFLWVAATVALVWGQRELPENYRPVRTPDRRRNVSRLPAHVACEAASAPARIPRRNFIDELIFDRMERDRIPHAPLASDAEFFRRVHLDVSGPPARVRRLLRLRETRQAD